MKTPKTARTLAHQPRQALVAVLSDTAPPLNAVLQRLADSGIDAHRCVAHTGPNKPSDGKQHHVHLPHWINHVLFPDLVTALNDGDTIIAIFDVHHDEQHDVQAQARAAGLEHLHYFGKWTYT